jgi:hypothetical protein
LATASGYPVGFGVLEFKGRTLNEQWTLSILEIMRQINLS